MGRWLIGIIVAAITAAARADVVLFVNATQTTGANNGSSWSNAFQGTIGLQNALAAAVPIATGGTNVQVWVAQGVYLPSNTLSTAASFNMQTRVGIYGGFAGTEVLLTERQPSVNVTTLSGVLQASPSVRSDNVVKASGVDSTAILDGFTITGGQCASVSGCSGGGLRIASGVPVVRNCSFVGNSAFMGGAIAVISGGLVLEQCTVSGNSAAITGGGGIGVQTGVVSLSNCTFTDNAATGTAQGGGLRSASGTIIAQDCTFANNRGDSGGGVSGSGIKLIRCRITGNRASQGYGGLEGSGFDCRDCLIDGNYLGTFGVSGAALGGSGTFIGCRFDGNISRGYLVDATSTSNFINCIFANNIALGGSGGKAALRLPGGSIVNCAFVNNNATNAVYGSNISIINSLAFGNKGTDSTPQISAAFGFPSGTNTIANSLAVGNTASSGTAQAAQVVTTGTATLTIKNSIIDGWTGSLGGVANSGLYPRFADPLGPDGVLGTADDDFRLLPGSPAIDSADLASLPIDTFDINGNANTTELLPWDLDKLPRVVDDPITANTGTGLLTYLDRGPYEYISGSGGFTSLWTASGGGTFSTGANWSPGVPGTSDEALFDSGGTYTVQFTQPTAILRRLSVRSGAVSFNLGTNAVQLSDVQYGLRLAPSTTQPMSLTVTGGTITSPKTLIRPLATLSGTPTLIGNIENGGAITPGGAAAGTITVHGAYAQYYTTPTGQVIAGTMSLDIAGTAAGQYDQVVASGGVTLSGALTINRLSNFDPPADLNVKLIDAPARTGVFSVASLPSLPPGGDGSLRYFRITYEPTDQGGSVFLNVGSLGGNVAFGGGSNPASTSSTPTAVATGDLNGDGYPDLVIALPGSPGAVLVFRNLGVSAGNWLGWSNPVQYPVGNEPGGVAIGELNGQPGLEIATANTGRQTINPPDGGSVTILVNDGSGNFTSQTLTTQYLSDSGVAPRGIAIAELEGGPTSLPEIALALSGSPLRSLVLENDGDLIFEPCPIPTGPYPTSVAIADLNGDNLLDLVFSNLGDGTVSVRINTPTQPMNFQTGPTLLTGPTPIQVITRDLNADGRPDIVTINQTDNTLSLIINRGSLTFDPQASLPAGAPAATPRSMVILDMDQDGDQDIAFVAGSESNVKVYRNDQNGGAQLSFSLITPIATPGTALLVTNGDVQNDGRDDLVPIVNGPADVGAEAVVLPNRFRSSCFTANCDHSTVPPILNALDFGCFLSLFAAGSPLANCDESTGAPVLNANDFGCFLNAFAAGCP